MPRRPIEMLTMMKILLRSVHNKIRVSEFVHNQEAVDLPFEIAWNLNGIDCCCCCGCQEMSSVNMEITIVKHHIILYITLFLPKTS